MAMAQQQPNMRAQVDYNQYLEMGWRNIKEQAISKLEQYLSTGDSKVMFSKKEYMQYYTTIYNLCTTQVDGFQSKLYNRYTESIADYLKREVVPKLVSLQGEPLLKELDLRWSKHQVMVRWMQRFFQYLDRFYVEMHSITGLSDQGNKLFKQIVFQPLLNNICVAVLEQIRKERDGDMVDVELLKNIIEIFIFVSSQALANDSVNCLKEIEQRILSQTQAYYQSKAQQMIEQYSLMEFLTLADQLLQAEQNRCNLYLTWDIDAQILQQFKQQVLVNHQETLLTRDNGIIILFQEDRLDDLALMYKLYKSNEECLSRIGDRFRLLIIQQGTAMIEQAEKSKENQTKELSVKDIIAGGLVEKLVEMLKKYTKMVKTAFCGDPLFTRRLQLSFEAFMNMDIGNHQMAVVLATYTDTLLRKGGVKLEPQVYNEFSEIIVKLFSHIIAKDLFLKVYQNFMARRLLSDKSEDPDHEKQFISNLKITCGYQQTKKLEGMISDLALAKEEMQAYAQQQPIEPGQVDFSIQCLTTSNWPSYKQMQVQLPTTLFASYNKFKAHYEKKHRNRTLNVCFSMGTSIVSFKQPEKAKPYELVLCTLGMCIVMLFNDRPSYNVKEIMAALNIDEETARKNIQCLCTNQKRILIFDKANDTVTINDSFSSNLMRVTLPIPALEESYKQEKVQEDRSHAVEAAIVKIMKSRRKLQMTQLVQEVLALLHLFQPNPKFIKDKIERLIEREFLARCDQDKSMLLYVA